MNKHFTHIGLFTKHNSEESRESLELEKVIAFLEQNGHVLFIEQNSATILKQRPENILSEQEIGKHCDLIIVVGGDGSLLRAARATIDAQVPILGINRGRLGFLADICPNEITTSLPPILAGNYCSENRSLLDVSIMRNSSLYSSQCALNDVVLYTGDISRILEFEIFIDEQFVMYQRADGLITATPTGSTAYSLSGGGPILYPTLNAFTLLPMFAHTLSSRPIVISDSSTIKLVISKHNTIIPKLSCDGQVHLDLAIGDEIYIKKYPKYLKLIHPQEFNYYALLQQKLGWNTQHTQLTSDRVKI